jgi:hypothetical protein
MKRFFIGKTKCKKKAYSSEEYADNVLQDIRKNSIRAKLPVRSYKCEICGWWHLTSRPYNAGKPLEKYLPGWKKFFEQ